MSAESADNDSPKPMTEPIWGDEWIETYLSVGDRYSKNNESMNLGFALTLLGQAAPEGYFYLGDAKHYTRVHPLMVQDSGTGKDPAFDFAKAIARETEKTFWDSNNLTNAGFVGTYDDEGEKIPGLAESVDIIGFREAVQLFKSAQATWDDGLAENINNVVDGKEVGRVMANGAINYEPTCSIVGTTYPPSRDDIDVEKLMRVGTLARFLFFHRDVSRKDRANDMRAVFGESEPAFGERYERIKSLGVTLDEMCSELGRAPRYSIEADKEAVYDRITEAQLSTLETVPTRVADAAEPAMSRYAVHTLRVACLLAALDRASVVVTEDHTDRALRYVERSWSELIGFIERYVKNTDEGGPDNSHKMLRVLAELDGSAEQSDVVDALPVGVRTVRTHARRLESAGLIEIEEGRGRGPSTRYKLVI